jgi:hypothetical protein
MVNGLRLRLGYGPADNSGHERSAPDTPCLRFTWGNAGCQSLPLDWFFSDTEEDGGSTPPAPTPRVPPALSIAPRLLAPATTANWRRNRPAQRSENASLFSLGRSPASLVPLKFLPWPPQLQWAVQLSCRSSRAGMGWC